MGTTANVVPSKSQRKASNEASRQEALSRAVSGQSYSNFPAIFRGFAQNGGAK